MRIALLLFASLILSPVGGAEDAVTNPAADKILQQLDEVGKNLQQFSAKVRLTETDLGLLTSDTRVGEVWFQKLPDGSARIHILFRMRVIDPVAHRAVPEKIEYLLDGPWLIDRNYQTKNEIKRQVLKPGQKMDLFKLGEGPFPLPIGQNPADVHRLFDVKLIAPDKNDPANAVHLQLLPRPGTELAKQFKSLDVWVDQKTHMPVRVDTTDVKEQSTRSTELSDIVVNPPGGLPDSDFQLPNIDNQNWNRHVESLNQ